MSVLVCSPGHSLLVESTFAGKSLFTDPVPHLPSLTSTQSCLGDITEAITAATVTHIPLKLITCAVGYRTKSKEQVGYLLLDLLRDTDQVPTLLSSQRYSWF